MDQETMRKICAEHRAFMKSDWSPVESGQTGNELGRPRPPLMKPSAPNAAAISLPPVTAEAVRKSDILACMRDRRTQRKYAPESMTLEELSFLLWATQGVGRVIGENRATFRTVPSGGARHPFETYLAILRVEDLQPGLYRYLPLGHSLETLPTPPDLMGQLLAAMYQEEWTLASGAIFFWSFVSERAEWAFGAAAHKTALLDAGHVAQNLYLACAAIGCGTCAMSGYHQAASDALLGLNGDDEFVVYAAPVGRLA